MIHLVHSPVDPTAFNRWAGQRNAFRKRHFFDRGAAFHTLLAEVFGPGIFQPFRVFAPDRGPWSLYGYTRKIPAELVEHVQITAMPETLAVLPPESLRLKPMPEVFQRGQRIGFDILARPVMRGKKGERDVYQTCCERAADAQSAQEMSRETIYRHWLEGKLAGAAEMQSAILAGFERRTVLRNKTPSEGPDAILHGVLQVSDPTAFATLLGRGIGRHKAYGYGMILLRPAGRPAPQR